MERTSRQAAAYKKDNGAAKAGPECRSYADTEHVSLALKTYIVYAEENSSLNMFDLVQDLFHSCDTDMLKDAVGKTFRLLGYTVQYGCIAHCAFEYLGGIVVCSGPSMEPTIQNSDILFSENLSCHFYNIQKYILIFPYLVFLRGDIVIAKNPTDPKSNICKRVMGLEGDKVCTSSPSDFLKIHSYVSTTV
ncbi:hypothetical protein JD844_021683 [Phrynosoma platyrhinos]|uniref:Peptidase S26 domain-containing protein n=1 Tax=Phrynosoma platyrhinos TaxID=52577 RepID=A0ABQ7SU31_PHRPL|nr:hypothetical protein JD844_021683 [Phrynosoma platyrhinos]